MTIGDSSRSWACAPRRAHTSRSRRSGRPESGFTLIELLIAVVIVGILSAVALPLYDQYQQRTYRSAATAVLGDCAQALERWYTQNFSYGGAAAAGADTGAPTICPTQSPENGNAIYDITIEAADDTTFTLRATPTAAGPASEAGLLEILASGERRRDRNDDGDATDAGEEGWGD